MYVAFLYGAPPVRQRFFYQPGHEARTWNGLNVKLNKTCLLYISGTPFIAQCAYSKTVIPIKVRLLEYTIPLWTNALITSEKMS